MVKMHKEKEYRNQLLTGVHAYETYVKMCSKAAKLSRPEHLVEQWKAERLQPMLVT
jgi:hypothetical protein